MKVSQNYLQFLKRSNGLKMCYHLTYDNTLILWQNQCYVKNLRQISYQYKDYFYSRSKLSILLVIYLQVHEVVIF